MGKGDAGRILILPKGHWNAETEYEMLDFVYYKGTSWLAKKAPKVLNPKTENIGRKFSTTKNTRRIILNEVIS